MYDGDYFPNQTYNHNSSEMGFNALTALSFLKALHLDNQITSVSDLAQISKVFNRSQKRLINRTLPRTYSSQFIRSGSVIVSVSDLSSFVSAISLFSPLSSRTISFLPSLVVLSEISPISPLSASLRSLRSLLFRCLCDLLFRLLFKQVEVASGSWICAEILSENGHNYDITYAHRHGVAIVERIPRKFIRPCQPVVKNAKDWAVGDMVEVLDNISWKVATVLKVIGGSYYMDLGKCEDAILDKSTTLRSYQNSNYQMLVGDGFMKLHGDDNASAQESYMLSSRKLKRVASNELSFSEPQMGAAPKGENETKHESEQSYLRRSGNAFELFLTQILVKAMTN
ncbi:hypothetical protein Syun_027249 [Stephania yunnanensis]|uniref:Agenet-like domain-containing protein n=1 Tax=Stephania yunnanensis TaxID=152371 RepID=A0AAP0HKW3_9MAGN